MNEYESGVEEYLESRKQQRKESKGEYKNLLRRICPYCNHKEPYHGGKTICSKCKRKFEDYIIKGKND